MDRQSGRPGSRAVSLLWWRSRFFEFVAAVVLAFAIVQLSNIVGQRQKDLLPPTAWFAVHEIFVPDHTMGSNPLVIYDRTIRQDFVAFWIVEVQRVTDDGLFAHVCSGWGQSAYEQGEIIQEDRVTWEWLIGRPCVVEPGEYRLRVSWTMKRPGWPEKELVTTSNLFRVTG